MQSPPSARYSRPGVRTLRALVHGLILVFGVPLRGTTWAQPVGAEFQVNTYTTYGQYDPVVAVDADGDFVVVWHSAFQDWSFSGVFGQRFTSAGVANGAEFQVNTYTADHQEYPAVASDADGDFVVVFESDTPTGRDYRIARRRYTRFGTPASGEQRVTSYTGGPNKWPAVASDAEGDVVVVVWTSWGPDGGGGGVFGKRYTSTGAAAGREFQVNTYSAADQVFPAVAADADGDFVVVWTSFGQDGSGHGVFGQRFTSAGTVIGAEFQVNTYTTGNQYAEGVAADADGDFVVVWSSRGQDGSIGGVFGQRYTSVGAAIGTEFQVNTYTTGHQSPGAVAADADGDFVVVWDSVGQDGSDVGIFGQRYTSAGTTVGGEFQVNTYTTGSQFRATVAADADGDFVVAWGSIYQDGGNPGVFAQRFQPTAETVTEIVGIRGTVTTDTEGDGATGGDRTETTVTTPNAGTIGIVEQAVRRPPPTGFQFLGQEVTITAPSATGGDPLVVMFELDAAVIPASKDQNSMEVFRDSLAVSACAGTSGAADPDPCVSSRVLQGDGDVEIIALTSSASDWNFGIQGPPPIPTLSRFGCLLLTGLLLRAMGWTLRRRRTNR